MSDLVTRLRDSRNWFNRGQCCGQVDSLGICAAPACIFGEALKEFHQAAARIAELEATVATIQAERDQLIGGLQIAVEQNGDMENPPAWVDAACRILNRGFLKVDRAALEGGKS